MEMQSAMERGAQSKKDLISENSGGLGCCGWILVIVLTFFTVLIFPITIFTNIKIVQEYEPAVIFKLGRITSREANEPVANVSNASTGSNALRMWTHIEDVMGTKNLAEVLSDQEGISQSMQVIAAEREMNPSRALKEASLVIAESPSALQLRYLQILNTIAAEKNSTIFFPLPMDIMSHFMKK